MLFHLHLRHSLCPPTLTSISSSTRYARSSGHSPSPLPQQPSPSTATHHLFIALSQMFFTPMSSYLPLAIFSSLSSSLPNHPSQLSHLLLPSPLLILLHHLLPCSHFSSLPTILFLLFSIAYGLKRWRTQRSAKLHQSHELLSSLPSFLQHFSLLS